MKNSSMLFFIFFIILVGGFFFIGQGKSNGEASNTIAEKLGDIQKITLSMKDYNYYPNTIKVSAGKPVEITLDSSIRGCYRALTIKSLGISKNSKNPEDKIQFTPNNKGTYRFSCVMGMGYGTLIVE